MKSKILTHFVILAVLGLVSMGAGSDSLKRNIDPPETVSCVDIDRYLGTWYEQARIPFFPQLGCIKSVAIYTLNPDK